LSKSEKREKTGGDSENIFSIVDRLVYQIDRTKKYVLAMVIAVIVAIPVSWHVSPLLLGTPYNFRLAGIVSIAIAAVFIAVGVRQWIVLSRWTRRYVVYKTQQKKVDESLDFENSDDRSGNSGT
jgi:hypothetical protein